MTGWRINESPKEHKMENEVELLEIEETPVAPSRALAVSATPSDLLRIAVEQGADLDKLERLMALQERWEANEARKAYDAAFAAFKSEAVKIIKNRDVTAGPLNGKRYAELFTVVNAITPALSKHGLSSSWKLTKDEKEWIEVTCTLKHTGGHTESVSMGGPPDAGGAKNAIQARASTVSYLERYTLKAITGLSEQDDDTDGNERAAADWMARVTEATTEDDLRKISREGTQAFTSAKNVTGYAAFMKAVQKRGAEIKGAAK
jgi:hypothetical protein